MAGPVYSVGHSVRPWEAFVELLRRWGVRTLADVRRFPVSRRHPHFCGPEMASRLAEARVRYVHLGATLGGYVRVPGGYPAYTGTPEFAEGLGRLEELAREAPTAFMCAERRPERCHRRFIAAALEARGWRVVHILGAEEAVERLL